MDPNIHEIEKWLIALQNALNRSPFVIFSEKHSVEIGETRFVQFYTNPGTGLYLNLPASVLNPIEFKRAEALFRELGFGGPERQELYRDETMLDRTGYVTAFGGDFGQDARRAAEVAALTLKRVFDFPDDFELDVQADIHTDPACPSMQKILILGPNDCFVTDNLISSAETLLMRYHLSPINFSDTCNLIETIVLHDQIFATLPRFLAGEESPLTPLVQQKICASTLDAIDANSDNPLERRIAFTAIRALNEGGVWGMGMLNMGSEIDFLIPHEHEIKTSVDRLLMGMTVVSNKIDTRPNSKQRKHWRIIRKQYEVFRDYADSLFNAAELHHLQAYAGVTELPYSMKRTINSVPASLYKKLKELHHDRVDHFLIGSGYRTLSIPPFASIVLSRSKTREDIIPQAIAAREEFTDFRNTCRVYAERIRDAQQSGSIKDISDIHNEFDACMEVLTKKATTGQTDTRFWFRVWDILKGITPAKIGANLLEQLIEHDIDRQKLASSKGLYDVWWKLQESSPYHKILSSQMFQHGDYHEFQEEAFCDFIRTMDTLRQVIGAPKLRE